MAQFHLSSMMRSVVRFFFFLNQEIANQSPFNDTLKTSLDVFQFAANIPWFQTLTSTIQRIHLSLFGSRSILCVSCSMELEQKDAWHAKNITLTHWNTVLLCSIDRCSKLQKMQRERERVNQTFATLFNGLTFLSRFAFEFYLIFGFVLQ